MRLFGVDFTSRPTNRKPITCSSGSLAGGVLSIEAVEVFPTFELFEEFLARSGPWRAGLDFPFGQPRRLITNLGLEGDWEAVVVHLTNRTRDQFVKLLGDYRIGRAAGDKQHCRVVDVLARSCSPMMVYGIPVAKMFFEGAPRLLGSGMSILPVRPSCDSRVAVEAYPKLVAQRYATGEKYKTESKRDQSRAQQRTRHRIVEQLAEQSPRDFGFEVRVAEAVREGALQDGSGDVLDSVLAAVQAAWSVRHREPPNGIPLDCDRLEGWIVDPGILDARRV